MPPKRRSVGTAANTATRSQSTLSFNNKSRVTKQSNILPPASDKKSITKRLSDQAKAEIVDEISSEVEEPQVAEIKQDDEPEAVAEEPQIVHVEEPKESRVSRPKRKTAKKESSYDVKLREAQKLSDAKVKAYWKAEEDSRLAPRVHQENIHIHEKILRHFDLSSQYGPCIGVTRLDRWKRASNLGLQPPVEVLAVLLKEETKGVDKGQNGRQCGRMAYIDELANGRVVLVE